MSVNHLYGRMRTEAEKLGRYGGFLQGRRTGDAVRDAFLREVRLNRAALQLFSQSERVEWTKHVRQLNDDLVSHWHREAYAQRAFTRKIGMKGGAPTTLSKKNNALSQIRAQRLAAIAQVIEGLMGVGKKPTTKAVHAQLKKTFPGLPLVELDTLRKDLRWIKVACQSG